MDNNISALECIIQVLALSEKEKTNLLTCLRRLGLNNDDDPVIEVTLVMGLLTKLTSEIPEKLKAERLASLQEYRALTAVNNEKLSAIADFLKTLEANWQDSYELWEVKKEGVKKEFVTFSKELDKYQNSLKELIGNAESIQAKLCFVSFGNIMIATTTTLTIIILFKFWGWL